MKKHTPKTIAQICTLLFCTLLAACTLHFKHDDLQIDTESKGIGIVPEKPNNTTYALTHADFL